MCESVRQAIQLSEVKYKYSGGADFISALKETTAYTARIHTQTHTHRHQNMHLHTHNTQP